MTGRQPDAALSAALPPREAWTSPASRRLAVALEPLPTTIPTTSGRSAPTSSRAPCSPRTGSGSSRCRSGARLGWFSPARRGVIPLEPFSPSRSLRRAARRYEIRVDTAFGDVVDGCARPGEPHELDRRTRSPRPTPGSTSSAGRTRSRRGTRTGSPAALYGVAIGGLFAAESMFHAPHGCVEGRLRRPRRAAPRGGRRAAGACSTSSG